MNKYLLSIGIAAIAAFASCNKTQQAEQPTTAKLNVADSYTIDSLLGNAENLVGDTITLCGTVKHTCKHSGRRCFIMNKERMASIRVEAKGEIGGFNRELIGSEIVVKGIVREEKISASDIAESEKSLEAQKNESSANEEHCDTELSNIALMKRWMEEHGKDYYAIYFVDGLNFDVVE